MKLKDYIDKGDLLSILLSDDLFKNDTSAIIDECLTFFFAGSQTSSIALQNMIYYLLLNPDQLKKAR